MVKPPVACYKLLNFVNLIFGGIYGCFASLYWGE